mgnify:CR=1 FL=1
MNNKAKYFIIGTVLLTAAAGSVAAIAGPGKCDQGERGKFGKGSPGHTMGRMSGNMPGQMGPMQGIGQLDNLTEVQKQQLSDLRQQQRQLMGEKRGQRDVQRAEVQAKVDAILTEEQREMLANMDSSGFGHHAPRGHHGG